MMHISMKTIFLFLFLLFAACSSNVSREKPYTNQTATYTDGIKINAYFSQTSGNYNQGGGIDDFLIADINSAQEEILVAIYALTNDRIRDALIDAYNRGVKVKLFTDEKELFQDDMKVIKEAGIPVLSDEDPSALMHNKFTVIDKKIVWTGSCNYSYYAFYRNNENLVKITGSKIAAVYAEEFSELWNHQLIEKAYISDVLEIYFSPEDDFEQRLLELISNAKNEIDFLAFAFTNRTIAEALIAKKAEGVIIKGVIDEKQNDYQKSSEYTFLKEHGIDIRLDGNKYTLHDKIFIIDDTVVTGSYNFTQKANDTNSENSIVVHNKAFKELYKEEFRKIYTLSKP
jgi:phosphatidylserine/phosphatidylglycerophosphate/cardiolipin synthase-like enzyme